MPGFIIGLGTEIRLPFAVYNVIDFFVALFFEPFRAFANPKSRKKMAKNRPETRYFPQIFTNTLPTPTIFSYLNRIGQK